MSSPPGELGYGESKNQSASEPSVVEARWFEFPLEHVTASVHRMSAELYPASANHATLHSATVGGSKPLHRFIRGQPKSAGVRQTCLPSVYFMPVQLWRLQP